jgi:hypothetical protein
VIDGQRDIISLFSKAGIQRESGSWQDYERGKRLVQDWPGDYDSGLKVLTQYLGV